MNLMIGFQKSKSFILHNDKVTSRPNLQGEQFARGWVCPLLLPFRF